MDTLSHFHSLDELIRALDRERKLLGGLFQDRKRLSFRYDVARDMAAKKDESLKFLRRFGVIRENGDFVELEDVYMKFFEEVLEVNEEINVASVKESIGNLNAAIDYYQSENSPTRKYGYLKDVRRILRNIALTTLRNVIDLKRNIDNTYKNEPTFAVKKKKLVNLDEKRKDIAVLINECEKVIDEKQATFFMMAMDVGLKETVTDVKLQLREVYHNLLELDRQIMADCKAKLDAKQHEMDEVEGKLTDTDSLLERTKGSLYEWLEANKRDWEQNIGKVINEESVLYQTGLHPQKDEGTSLFGVKLDLTDLSLAVRKPAQLKAVRAKLDAVLRSLKAEYVGLTQLQEKQQDELKRRFAPKMRELREQKSYHETELRVIPQKRKTIQLKKEDYVAKAQHEKKEKTEQLNARLQDVTIRRTAADTELAKIQNDKQKQLSSEDKRHQKAKEEAVRQHEQRVAEIRADIRLQEQNTDKELQLLQQQEHEELHGRGADTRMVEECKASIKATEAELKYIDDHRRIVFDYQRDSEELFDHEEEFKTRKKLITDKLQQLNEKYDLRKQNHNETLNLRSKELNERREEKSRIDNDLQKAERFTHDVNLCPPMLAEAQERQTLHTPGLAVDKLTGIIVSRQKSQDKLKSAVNVFKGNFTAKNTFNFRTELALDEDYLDFANNLEDFLVYNKIEEFRRRTSERYVDILGRVSKEMGDLTRHESDVDKVIHDINNDFRERNFTGVIKLIALQPVPSADKMVLLMKRIKDFHDDNQYTMGELNLFSSANRDEVNQKAVGHLLDLMKSLVDNPQRRYLTLSDLFLLQFRIVENDNDTGWVDKLSHVGSEGTDTLVKAMINIMLINVFKGKVSRKFGDFRIHCMMDEIGKLHPQNVKGILDFANARNILLINSSPTTYNVSDYRYTYLLSKDSKSQTVVNPLISQQ